MRRHEFRIEVGGNWGDSIGGRKYALCQTGLNLPDKISQGLNRYSHRNRFTVNLYRVQDAHNLLSLTVNDYTPAGAGANRFVSGQAVVKGKLARCRPTLERTVKLHEATEGVD